MLKPLAQKRFEKMFLSMKRLFYLIHAIDIAVNRISRIGIDIA